MADAADRDRRLAAVAAALSRAVSAGEVEGADAVRIIRHEFRRRNTNRALKAPLRSRGAQDVIARYTANGDTMPKGSSPDALHCDHITSISAEHLRFHGVMEWLRLVEDLDRVVCVTAAEQHVLEQIEKKGMTGWGKYAAADIEVFSLDGSSLPT